MQYSKVLENKYLLRLEKGEDVHVVLTSFCEKEQVLNGSISAIGSVEKPTLAHYLVSTKKYTEKTLTGVYEITSMQGTIGIFEEKPLIHIHAALSDEEMKGFGGHLVQATVSATLEVIIEKFDTKFEKKFNDEIGLKLFNLKS